MSLFALAGLSLAVACFGLALFIFTHAKNSTHKIWACFNVVVALWGAGTFLSGIATNIDEALISWRITYLPCTFISIVFYHLVSSFTQDKSKKFLVFAYLQGFLFQPLIVGTDLFANSVILVFDSIYYHKATVLFTVWLLIWGLVTLVAFLKLFRFSKLSKGIKKKQSLYLFWGMVLGFTGGTTSVIPSYQVPVYPAWHFTICIYAVIMTYAMFKYRFMDLSIVVTRTGIFIAVYSIVLGLPFAIAFGLEKQLEYMLGAHWWIFPLVSSTVLATIGPYIYMFIQQKAEDRLLQEQRLYQATLRKASLGMGRIKDLRRLVGLIVHIVTRAVRIEHCEIFLLHEESQQYILKGSKGAVDKDDYPSSFKADNPIIKLLLKLKEPLVYEEIQQREQDYTNKSTREIQEFLICLDAALVVPSFIEQRLIAVIVLGRKKSEKLYSQDDLAVFSILANQAALAIENAQFYEDMKKTQEQLFKAEKMATIGTMADGLSHQINNRLHALGFIAGDALDTIKLKKTDGMSAEMKEFVESLKVSLEKIEDNVKRGGEIVGGLLKYTRKGEQGFAAVEFSDLLDAAIEMVQFKVNFDQLKLTRNFNGNIPQIKGNFTQLQEVFFNIIDNANDAMMQRKDELKESEYAPELIISAQKKGKKIEILINDNGIGVKPEDTNKLFTPFFTTKLSSKKGTGLGMYVIRQIIEDNHRGKVEFTSQYKKGSQTRILLPVADQASSEKS